MSDEELLHASILGVETECRIGKAVSPSHYRRGWHITSTCGVFGAAAAAGKPLRLDERCMVWALGNAAAQSAAEYATPAIDAKRLIEAIWGIGNEEDAARIVRVTVP